MVISCCKCGRPLVEVDMPDVETGAVERLTRALGRFGMSELIPADIGKYLRPTPETIAEELKPRCPDGC